MILLSWNFACFTLSCFFFFSPPDIVLSFLRCPFQIYYFMQVFGLLLHSWIHTNTLCLFLFLPFFFL
jgi:hypothetical protein